MVHCALRSTILQVIATISYNNNSNNEKQPDKMRASESGEPIYVHVVQFETIAFLWSKNALDCAVFQANKLLNQTKKKEKTFGHFVNVSSIYIFNLNQHIQR